MVDPVIVTPSEGAGVASPYVPIVQPNGTPRPYNCMAGTVPTKPSFTPSAFYAEMLQIHSVMLSSARPGDVLFFGDSITQELVAAKVTPFGVNFGISGNTPEGVLWKFNEYFNALKQAGAVSLMIGTNSLRAGSPPIADIQDYIMRIINWCTGPFVWNDILYTGSPQPDYNSNIATVNTYIKAQIAERPTTAVVNLNPIVAPGGSLLSAYSDDGLHLNGAGHAVWTSALQEALKALS